MVRLLFEKFAELGTVNRLLQYLVRHGIRLGIRPHCGPNRGNVEWRRPCRETLLNILHHPCFAGEYSHGRRPVDPRRKIPGRPGTGRRVASWEECEVLIRDHYPAYITWEQFLANQQRLAENRARAESRGAPREGPALLAGLLVCGRTATTGWRCSTADRRRGSVTPAIVCNPTTANRFAKAWPGGCWTN